MKVKVVSQTKNIFEGDADSVSVNSVKGRIELLPKHTDIITRLDIGELRLKSNQKVIRIAINGGLAIFKDEEITILANEAYMSHELIAKDIENAISMALEKKTQFTDSTELIQLEKQLRFLKLIKEVEESK